MISLKTKFDILVILVVRYVNCFSRFLLIRFMKRNGSAKLKSSFLYQPTPNSSSHFLKCTMIHQLYDFVGQKGLLVLNRRQKYFVVL